MIDKFQEIIGGDVDDMIKKNARSHEVNYEIFYNIIKRRMT